MPEKSGLATGIKTDFPYRRNDRLQLSFRRAEQMKPSPEKSLIADNTERAYFKVQPFSPTEVPFLGALPWCCFLLPAFDPLISKIFTVCPSAVQTTVCCFLQQVKSSREMVVKRMDLMVMPGLSLKITLYGMLYCPVIKIYRLMIFSFAVSADYTGP